MPAELPKHAGRHEPRHRRPVPELAVIIGSPAVHARARTRRNGAGVVQTCRGDAQAEGASGHRRRQLGQRRVITDLTAAVVTPAVSDAEVETPQVWFPPPLTTANTTPPCTAVGTSLSTV